MPGDERHRGEHLHRVEHVEPATAVNPIADAVLLEPVQSLEIDEEHAVEQTALVNPRQVLIPLGVEDQVGIALRVPPASEMMTGRTGAHMAQKVHFRTGPCHVACSRWPLSGVLS